MPAEIVEERPDTGDALQLIAELESVLAPLYPQESRRGFSVEKLLRAGVAFFVTRQEGVAAGCGGIELVGKGMTVAKSSGAQVLNDWSPRLTISISQTTTFTNSLRPTRPMAMSPDQAKPCVMD